MKDAITIDGTDAALTKQGEDTSTATKLYRTLDAAQMANIQTTEPRNARRRFLAIADRLNLKPADERRRESGGGSLQKFWTLEQVQAVKAEHERTAKPITIADRVERIKKYSADAGRNVIKIGYELAAAKDELPHGAFADWLKKNFGWTQRTANNFMRIAQRFGDNPEFATFKPSTLQAMLALPEEEIINIKAEIDKTDKQDQLEQKMKAAAKYKKRKKNPAPVTADTPHAQIDSESVNDISNNDGEGKMEINFQFEGDKPRNDAIFKGSCTPCQDPATQPADALTIQEEDSAVDSEPVTTSGDNTATDSPADETADALIDSELVPDPYEARRLEFVADMNKSFDEMIDSLLDNVVHVEVLQHMRDYVIKRVDERLADFARAQKSKPAADIPHAQIDSEVISATATNDREEQPEFDSPASNLNSTETPAQDSATDSEHGNQHAISTAPISETDNHIDGKKNKLANAAASRVKAFIK